MATSITDKSGLSNECILSLAHDAARDAHIPEEPTASEASDSMRSIEVSIVMPCLNEADTLETCIVKAQNGLRENNISGEIIIADNGSTDGCQNIAFRLGARVVPVDRRGYGSALMGGIAAALGKYIIMGDADDSYDFREVPKFVAQLRNGADLVQGCRLPNGGGQILPGAMPFSHRWLGNPLFTFLVRRMFWSQVHDVYCGMRAFTRLFYERLDLRCTGMEFATEMIIKASFVGGNIAEVPICLHPDGRKSHPPHLKTVRDGWRTLRFFLMCCPRWLFLYPGAFMTLIGIIGYAVALPGLSIYGLHFDVHTLLFASLAILLGYQSIHFAVCAKTFAIGEGLIPEDPRLTRIFGVITLERTLVIGVAATAIGNCLLAVAVNQWRCAGFGTLDYAQTMRWVIPGVTITALGFQTVLSSFFLSILRMRRR